MRAWIGGLAVSLSLAAPAAAQPAADAGPITLAELEAMALEANPTLGAANARVEAARGRADQAGAWPNPMAGYSGEEIRAGDRDRRGEHGFFVEQTIPLGGKLRLSRALFERAVDRTEIDGERQRQRVRSSVRQTYYDVLTTERRVEIYERLAALAGEAIEVTAQLFNVGAADRPDYLESEIESRRIALELNEARHDAVARRQRLAAVVGRVEVADRRLAGSVDAALPALDRDQMLDALLGRSPQLLAARAELAQTEAATALARRDAFPDLFLRAGAAHNRERGEDTGRPIGWEGTLEAGVTLPLFDRNRGAIAAAGAEQVRAQAELQRVELALRAQLADEFAAYRTAVEAAETYRQDILPRAEEALRLYLARYREMAAAYPQVLIAQRGLFELSVRYVDSLARAWQSAMRIEGLLVGDGLQPAGVEGDADGEAWGRR